MTVEIIDLLTRDKVSRTILRNTLDLMQREQVGLVKYGVALPDAKLDRRQILQHAREEALDLANYLEAEIHIEDSFKSQYLDLRHRLDNMRRDADEAGHFVIVDQIDALLRGHVEP